MALFYYLSPLINTKIRKPGISIINIQFDMCQIKAMR